MKYKIVLLTLLISTLSNVCLSQTQDRFTKEQSETKRTIAIISDDLRKISKSIKSLNSDLVKVYRNSPSNIDLNLTAKQQKILVSFEILNHAEQRLGALQKLRIELMEKQTDIDSKISEVELELRSESIDRNVALQGTTNAQELKDKRREMLESKKRKLNDLSFKIQSAIAQNDSELLTTTQLVDEIRYRLFPAIYEELPKLDSEN